MVPIIFPIGRKLCLELVLMVAGNVSSPARCVVIGGRCRGFVCIDVEDDFFLTVLLYTVLPLALGDKRTARADELAWEYIEADGYSIVCYLQAIVAIDLYPLVVSVQVDTVILLVALVCYDFSISHDVCHDVVGRSIFQGASGLGKSW